jgi:hypothetical protein
MEGHGYCVSELIGQPAEARAQDDAHLGHKGGAGADDGLEQVEPGGEGSFGGAAHRGRR